MSWAAGAEGGMLSTTCLSEQAPVACVIMITSHQNVARQHKAVEVACYRPREDTDRVHRTGVHPITVLALTTNNTEWMERGVTGHFEKHMAKAIDVLRLQCVDVAKL